MPRKRKVAVPQPEVDQENLPRSGPTKKYQNDLFNDDKAVRVGNVVIEAQKNASLHEKCIKQMHVLYKEMKHETFIKAMLHFVQLALVRPADNKPTDCMLEFCAKVFVSFEQGDTDSTHPVICDVFKWLLETTSYEAHARFRMCEFVNTLFNAFGDEAQIYDDIWDNIQKVMLERLRDTNANVRQQAVFALQRLQDPSNADDKVIKSYLFHMETDPSDKVRRAVIASIAKNQRLIPSVIGRLWDVEDSVRRLAYLQLAKYPVTNLRVVQRHQILDQGINESSHLMKKCVSRILLPNWIQAYDKNYIKFISALKLDANMSDLENSKKLSVNALQEIFQEEKQFNDVIEALDLSTTEETKNCVKLQSVGENIELLIFWQAVIQYLNVTDREDVDTVLPDMSVIAQLLKNFIEINYKTVENDEDKMIQLYFQFEVLLLLEIINGYEFDDEIGRQALQPILLEILQKVALWESSIKIICEIFEKLNSNSDERLNMLASLIQSITDPALTFNFEETNKIIDEYLETSSNVSLMTELSALKLAIFESIEKRDTAKARNNHAEALQHQTDIDMKHEEYKMMIKPILESSKDANVISLAESLYSRRRLSPKTISKCLLICFYMVAQKSVKQLTPAVVDLYKKFVRNYMESQELGYRILALKVATTYCMLYETLASDVYNTLARQFVSTHSVNVMQTSILSIFELLDFYGFEKFNLETSNNRTNGKSGRTLYNTNADDTEDEETIEQANLISFLLGLLDKCAENNIVLATVLGFCRLILHKWLSSADIVAKLLLKYFNPATDDVITQTLGEFFKELISRRLQELLQQALFPTLKQIIDAPPESPLRDVETTKLIQFVINSTRPEFSSPGLNMHNTIALSFFNILEDDSDSESNTELIKLLSGELHTLEIGDDRNLRDDFKKFVTDLLADLKDAKVVKGLIKFKEMLEKKETNETAQTEKMSDDDEVASVATQESTTENVDGVFKVPPAKEKPTDTFVPATPDSSTDSDVSKDGPTLIDVPHFEDSEIPDESMEEVEPLPEFELIATQEREKEESFFVTSTQNNSSTTESEAGAESEKQGKQKKATDTRRNKREHPPSSPVVASPARKIEKRGSVSSQESQSAARVTRTTTKTGVLSNTTMTRTKAKTGKVPAPVIAGAIRKVTRSEAPSTSSKSKTVPVPAPVSTLPKRIPKPTEKAKAAAEIAKKNVKSPVKSSNPRTKGQGTATESPQRLSVTVTAPKTPTTPRSRATTRGANQTINPRTPEVIVPQTPESSTKTRRNTSATPGTSNPVTPTAKTPKTRTVTPRSAIASPDIIPGSPMALIGLRSLTKKNLRSGTKK